MDYVVAVQAPVYPLSPTSFAVESAFAEHLRMLRSSIGDRFARLVLIAPLLSAQDFVTQKSHLGTINLEEDEILLVPGHPQDASPLRFWRNHAFRIWRQSYSILARGGVLHSGMSTDIWRPLMALVNFAALCARQPVIFFVDIDFRQHSKRLYQLGIWNRRAYVVNRLIHDPLKWLQVRLARHLFQLVMLKSASMVRDFGGGCSHVKNFFDTAHSREHLLPEEKLQERREAMLADGPLRIVYFGRLVSNKGIDRIIAAVGIARADGADVTLSIIGDGSCLEELKQQAQSAGLSAFISFHSQLPYGKALFAHLDEAHLMAAAPLIEDTPRAAFDAMARGLPIVAFDISYFKDLAECSGGVALAQWPEARALAQAMTRLCHDRTELADMAARSLAFAAENTQEAWLERRAEWMREFALKEPAAAPSTEFLPAVHQPG